ncbi:GAF domain-containing protein [Sporosarcina sp. ANT_H38]|uniref:GAF domain-containing sensor histidine kinase n=1 Tax=Sporosarcina sp. ANT_H38 TaxID=2597358 RepID=UPI0011F39CAF|nr:GAF domain-containing sensor histidine kinase [Sporosarcina sp. ANT_H38]KAA0965706.1 GAF domain-containing protein [Sporosarcina sp. ANT_H38]
MYEDIAENELKVLKVIAETLNRSNDLNNMLQSVLIELLKVTGLATGWIFLVDEKPRYSLVASANLPAALSFENNKRMRKGTCFCLNEYWDGKLTEPVNMIECKCKRLENAVKYSWGDTNGISHHATIPLSAGTERFGILNVASPGKKQFSKGELTLLQSVAYQIGTAIKRTQLYHSQKNRAESFEKLDEVIRFIWGISDVQELPGKVVEASEKVFQWPVIAFYMKEGSGLRLHALNKELKTDTSIRVSSSSNNDISKAYFEQKIIKNKSAHHQLLALGLPGQEASIAIPLLTLGEVQRGVLFVAGKKETILSDSEIEVLKALSDHISLAMESILVNEKRQELLLYEERNRLARDLHDSVNQKLFSLSLTSSGVKAMILKDDTLLREAMNDIQQLSQDALKEMKSLIWQLRPAGVEMGLIAGLKKYGNNLGLAVSGYVEGVHNLSRAIEETLWRIGQEALNNIKKHADTRQVFLRLHTTNDGVFFEVSDQGNGFHLDKLFNEKWSLGLISMRERAELAGGSLEIQSSPGEGTTLNIIIPWLDKEGSDCHGY